jgi:hypothetical protein
VATSIDEIIALIETSEFLPDKKIQGYSLDEIEHLSKELDIELPSIYIEYLHRLGKRNPSFFDQYSTSIESVTKARAELLRFRNYDINVFPVLYRNVIYFQFQEGSQFFFFFSGESDDPIVYEYLDDWVACSFELKFSDFMMRQTADTIESNKQSANRKFY